MDEHGFLLGGAATGGDFSERYLATTDNFYDDTEIDEVESRLAVVVMAESFSAAVTRNQSNQPAVTATKSCQPAVTAARSSQPAVNATKSSQPAVIGSGSCQPAAAGGEVLARPARKKVKHKQQQSSQDKPVILWFRRDLRYRYPTQGSAVEKDT